MATFTKLALQPAGTTGTGLGIKVAATATAGTAIHTASSTATTIDEICGKLRDFLKGCGFSFDEIGVIDYDKEDQDEEV